MRIWLPYVKTGSGTDVFTRSLAEGLSARGFDPVLQSFPKIYQYYPWGLRRGAMPAGTRAVIANSWTAIGFHRPGVPLISVEHLCVHDPAYRPYKNFAQHIFHATLVRRAEADGFRAAAEAVAVSKATAIATDACFPGVSPIVIRNGVDLRFFAPDPALRRVPPADPSRAGSERRLLFVGNVSRRKGADVLPKVLDALGEDYLLDYTGTRDAVPEALAKHPRARPLGRLDREGVRDAFLRADMLLFPTRLEGLPLSAMEAMACGLPVAGFRTSSMPEIIDHRVDGLLAPVDHVETLAQAIRVTLSDRRAYEDMSAEARRKALAQFNERRMFDAYADLLRRLIEEAAEARSLAPDGPTGGPANGRVDPAPSLPMTLDSLETQ